MDDIRTDFDDYKVVLAHKGRIEGYVGECLSDNFINEIETKFVSSLATVKGAIIEFEIGSNNPNKQLPIIIEYFNTIMDTEADLLFGLKHNEALSDDQMKYSIILTGLEDPKSDKFSK